MLAQDKVLKSGEHSMSHDGRLDKGIENRPAHIDEPAEDEEEQRRRLDLRIGLALLGEEGRKQLLQYMRTLCKRDEEQASERGRIPSA
jgi:hypothetical protein